VPVVPIAGIILTDMTLTISAALQLCFSCLIEHTIKNLEKLSETTVLIIDIKSGVAVEMISLEVCIPLCKQHACKFWLLTRFASFKEKD